MKPSVPGAVVVPARARTAALAAGVALTIAASLLAAPLALARVTPIYRCGNAYSQWPCPSARTVAIDDVSPSPAEQADSVRSAAAQARRAERLRAERLAAEARSRPVLAGSLGPVPSRASVAPGPRRSADHRKTQALQGGPDGDFIAHVPAPPKHRSAPR